MTHYMFEYFGVASMAYKYKTEAEARACLIGCKISKFYEVTTNKKIASKYNIINIL